MDVSAVIEDVPFDELRIGDVLLSWRTAGSNRPYELRARERLVVRCYHDQIDVEGHDRFTVPSDHLVYMVRRTSVTMFKRVPCVKCGKSLHPELVSTKGYTHGC